MPQTTLVSATDLWANPEWIRIDCRFQLNDTDFGAHAYAAGHIPGARYAHLDADLSGPIVPGKTGRHPLPDLDVFRTRLGLWGIHPASQVVAYDDGPGAFAARLWWLLRYMGHEAGAVLDGGLQAWLEAGFELETGSAAVEPIAPYPALPSRVGTASADQLAGSVLVDARGEERYRGEVEPLDAVAGHIPGARNRPFLDNIDQNGRFRPAEELRARFDELGTPEDQIHYCGSGVTGAHNLLAMEVAGLPGARLYPGSWSEWITDPDRPVATGQE